MHFTLLETCINYSKTAIRNVIKEYQIRVEGWGKKQHPGYLLL
ncbi:19855_t:CDS:2 [Gigaspora margarita]|uniref:19855_t:CDS:1 n=1 Tax=Gigaspora margarita TaxID=4874 RepID=A0ABN7UMM2_GIGMA|nr:19855_t:CDS:2 [Gigaspora margarita]